MVSNFHLSDFIRLLKALLFFLGFLISTVHAFNFIEKTALIEIKQGSELSEKVDIFRTGGYETSAGTPIKFQPWYSTSWTDSRITFMTQVNQHLGIIWGFSTGEIGGKYSIDPSLKLGLAIHQNFDKSSTISLRATTLLGGNLHESMCVADYGDIGGVQQVNCRLAASQLPPNQTLQYMFNDKPYNQNTIMLEYKKTFN